MGCTPIYSNWIKRETYWNMMINHWISGVPYFQTCQTNPSLQTILVSIPSTWLTKPSLLRLMVLMSQRPSRSQQWLREGSTSIPQSKTWLKKNLQGAPYGNGGILSGFPAEFGCEAANPEMPVPKIDQNSRGSRCDCWAKGVDFWRTRYQPT